MKIEKREVIFLSQKEVDVWTEFFQIVEGIERESNDPDIIYHVSEIIDHMSILREEIKNID